MKEGAVEEASQREISRSHTGGFDNEGRGHMPWNAGSLWKLEKAKK